MGVTLTAEDEATLIARARSTNVGEREAAFAEIVRQLGKPLLALCLGITGNRADAEDALQESLQSIAASLPRFRGEARLFTWSYRIALRAATRIKAKNVDRRAEMPIELATGASDPAEAREKTERLLAAVEQLSAEQRVVLSLFAEGCSHHEIAEILGVPEGTVWSRLHLARKRLRALLPD